MIDRRRIEGCAVSKFSTVMGAEKECWLVVDGAGDAALDLYCGLVASYVLNDALKYEFLSPEIMFGSVKHVSARSF